MIAALGLIPWQVWVIAAGSGVAASLLAWWGSGKVGR